MVWVELLLPHSKPILVGIWYRPENVYTFWNIFDEFCVEKERFTHVETIAMGDFNCDFVGKSNSSLYKSFKQLLSTFNWFQLIDYSREVSRSIFNKHITSTIRSLKSYRPTKKKIEQLKEMNWFQVLNCDVVGKARYAFHGLLIFGCHWSGGFSEKLCLKQRLEPWVTHEILELIK